MKKNRLSALMIESFVTELNKTQATTIAGKESDSLSSSHIPYTLTIAPRAIEEDRIKNRRVEFLIWESRDNF